MQQRAESQDDYQAAGTQESSEGESSPAFLCFLITLYFTGYAFQYYIFNLYLTKLEGNKFVNAVIFGGAETLSVFLSGYLMSRLSDMTVFRIIFFAGVMSYSIFIFAPDLNTIMIYLANCVFVGSLGGWQNLGSLVSELRVPPQSLGSVNMIAQTAGVGLGSIVPFIS